MADRTLVFFATYNERDNVERLAAEILALPLGCDLLVVDDSSPDGTGELLDELAAAEPRLTVIHRPAKLGLGTAHKLAMCHAMQRDYDVLVTMDADYSHAPSDIPRLIAAIDDAEFAIGSRYMPGGSCDYTGYRLAVSRLANALAHRALRIPLHELTTSFRAFRVASLARIDVAHIRAQGYSFFLESAYRFHRAGFRLHELPIHFVDRRHGSSKIPRFEVVNGMARLLRLMVDRWLRRQREPYPPADVPGPCVSCGAPYVVELYPKRGGEGGEDDGVEAYRCTSMSHESKPRVVSCLQCGLSYAPEGLRDAGIEERYADVVDDEYLANAHARRVTFEKLLDRLDGELSHPGTILEIGAYCGLFGEVAARRGWRYTGIEPSRWAAGYAHDKLGLTVYQGTLAEHADRLQPPYDAVVLWDVLEHVREPLELLRQARGLVADDGRLCFTTLDMDTWFPRITGPRWPWIMDMHLYYFTRRSLGVLLRTAGFELLQDAPYVHRVSARYLARKVEALAPAAVRPLIGFAGRLTPSAILIPIGLGDVRLFVCRPRTERSASTPADARRAVG